MNGIETPDFIVGYTRILTQAWSSEDFCERLASHPRQVLADNGLEIPRNTVVRIVRSSDAEPDLQAQIEMWQQGAVTGKYILHVPYLPQMDVSDLSDEELGDLAGGAAGCCCSPAAASRSECQ